MYFNNAFQSKRDSCISLLDEKGEPLNMNEGMLSDAIATTIGAICGTSTVTTFSEVNAGVAAGGRTGLASLFCGGFFVAMLLLTHWQNGILKRSRFCYPF